MSALRRAIPVFWLGRAPRSSDLGGTMTVVKQVGRGLPHAESLACTARPRHWASVATRVRPPGRESTRTGTAQSAVGGTAPPTVNKSVVGKAHPTFERSKNIKATKFLTVMLGVAVTGSVSTLRAQAIQPPLLVNGQGSGNILRYDGETGAFIDEFVSPGVGGLCQGVFIGPAGMVFGPDGNLYVTCAVGNVGFVLRYDGRTGVPLPGPWGTPGTAEFVPAGSGGLINPPGLEFGPGGNLYVARFEADRVLRYNGQTGAFIDAFVTTSSGGLDAPTGLVFGPDGHLYVSSHRTD